MSGKPSIAEALGGTGSWESSAATAGEEVAAPGAGWMERERAFASPQGTVFKGGQRQNAKQLW